MKINDCVTESKYQPKRLKEVFFDLIDQTCKMNCLKCNK